MEAYTRTDLACESVEKINEKIAGTEWKTRKVADFEIQSLKILSEEATRKIGKPRGIYITLHCGNIAKLTEAAEDLLVRLLAGELRGMTERMTGKQIGSDLNVFVAGLGNAALTADAIGPETVARLTVTRHLREHEESLYQAVGCCALSALAPGVLGQTGIETLEILRGAIRSVHPDVMIVIDALAARSCDRLARTVQLSDTGIIPGSGVGNHREAINAETVGAPVIAIGVPTVVDSSTLVYDALDQAEIQSVDEKLRAVLETGRSFFVCPKESDLITERISALLARAIGIAYAEELHTK